MIMRNQSYKNLSFIQSIAALYIVFFLTCSMSVHAQEPISLAGHLGKVSKQDLENDTSNTAWFQVEFFGYHPRLTKAQEKIIKSKKFQVVIILGTWCSDSRTQVPRLFKLFYDLGINPPVTLITTDRTKKVIEPGFVHITAKYVPYFIFRDEEGNEIGEIIETPHKSLEADLAAILKKIKNKK